MPIIKAVIMTEIERLVISSNKLTDRCIDDIIPILKGAKHLKTLNMVNNPILHSQSKTKLVGSLKKIDIVIWNAHN